ncbi:hypothetical protein HMPREF0262_00548 [Clostridium sp. ATCC 29733]|nr:hypothetical protein HMPREF0262_00548 [Clostridium sp. ATCC 29733]
MPLPPPFCGKSGEKVLGRQRLPFPRRGRKTAVWAQAAPPRLSRTKKGPGRPLGPPGSPAGR